MTTKSKTLFYGLSVEAPWEEFPKARILEEEMRHLTLAYVGSVAEDQIASLSQLPKNSMVCGIGGHFPNLLFLPPKEPRVVAYQPLFYEESSIQALQKELQTLVHSLSQAPEKERPWQPHVTVGRAPFDRTEWEGAFIPIPFVCNKLHLYESLDHSKYKILSTQEYVPPFEEVPHTADYAFRVRGLNVTELYRHAQLALMFLSSEFIPYYDTQPKETLTDCIVGLNGIVSTLDRDHGSPVKAISFHGTLQKEANHVSWLMILDV